MPRRYVSPGETIVWNKADHSAQSLVLAGSRAPRTLRLSSILVRLWLSQAICLLERLRTQVNGLHLLTMCQYDNLLV